MKIPTITRENCTMMFFDNLASPYWSHIDCTGEYLRKITCANPRYVVKAKLNTNVQYPNFCNEGFIMKNRLCYKFTWYHLNHTGDLECANPDTITYIFNAVRTISFPFVAQAGGITTLKRYFQTTLIDTTSIQVASGGFCISTEDQEYFVKTENMFKCSNGAYISPVFVCDGTLDCSHSVVSDESNCTCEQTDNITNLCQQYRVSDRGILAHHCSTKQRTIDVWCKTQLQCPRYLRVGPPQIIFSIQQTMNRTIAQMARYIAPKNIWHVTIFLKFVSTI